MSHATVLVLTPTKPDDVDDLLSLAMEPFNEDKEVAPYIEECYCVSADARRYANDMEKLDFEKARLDFNEAHPNIKSFEMTKEQRKAWRAVCDASDARRDALEKAHASYGKPDPTCDECKGSGKVTTTSNPKSKWDWYSVGGRWDGLLPGERNEAPLIEIINWIQNNKDEDGAPDACTFAVLAGDSWNERGEMGWFGHVSNENDEFDAKYAKICEEYLAKNPNAYAILVDFHI